MSKIEVINFEEKVRKMKRSSKVNGFSGMIKNASTQCGCI